MHAYRKNIMYKKSLDTLLYTLLYIRENSKINSVG